MRIALCQIPVSSEPGVNLQRVRGALGEAAAGGAELAVFPEATLTRFGSDLRAAAQPLDGPFISAVASACAATWMPGPGPSWFACMRRTANTLQSAARMETSP